MDVVPPETSDHNGPTKFAWQVHLAQEAWTTKVDTKGSIMLALQGGALFAILSASGKDGALARLDGLRRLLEIAGVMAFLLAIMLAGLAVFPRLGTAREQRSHHRDHLVYFGHLRHWTPDELRTRIQRLCSEDELTDLAGQLVRISRTNWAKYRLVQLSLVLTLTGVLAASSAALLP
jgi:hypothetical protein